MSTRTPNRNPRYESVSQMEAAAAGEHDDTCNMRLWARGFTTEWLRVVWYSTGYRYYSLVGRAETEIDRKEAQRLIDCEWGKL